MFFFYFWSWFITLYRAIHSTNDQRKQLFDELIHSLNLAWLQIVYFFIRLYAAH